MLGRGVSIAAATVVTVAVGVMPAASAVRAAAKGATAAASYPPVVAQALAALRGRGTALALGAPTSLPTEPPSHTYLTALTQSTTRGWRVDLVKADQAYAVDNPAITSRRAHAVGLFAFGAASLSAALPRRASAAEAAALWRDGRAARGLRAQSVDGLPGIGAPGVPVSLGHGIIGDVYAGPAGLDSVVWREGDWTLGVLDTTESTALALARPVVGYLHKAYMPPHPGLVVVTIGVHGVVTRVDWTTGPTVYWIDNRLEAGNNPVDACAMAVSWRGAGQ